MDVNRVRFGNYFIGNQSAGAKKNEKKEQQEAQLNLEDEKIQKQVDANSMFDAMNIASLQNKANISIKSKNAQMPDISKYVSDESAARIEAMMGDFENGVNFTKSILENEFPNILSENQKNSLAAKIFAQE